MNEANNFYEDMQSRRNAVLNWRTESGTSGDENTEVQPPPKDSVSGNGEETKEPGAATTKDGTPSPVETGANQTPNG